jgi:putative transposase
MCATPLPFAHDSLLSALTAVRSPWRSANVPFKPHIFGARNGTLTQLQTSSDRARRLWRSDALLYPLAVVWPSGWAWHPGAPNRSDYFMMIDPAVLRWDNGPELACAAIADWARDHIGLYFIPPGEPGATATLSPSNPGCATNASTSTPSWSLTQARVVIGEWKHDYNNNHHHRRHSSLGYLPPARYAATCTHR